MKSNLSVIDPSSQIAMHGPIRLLQAQFGLSLKNNAVPNRMEVQIKMESTVDHEHGLIRFMPMLTAIGRYDETPSDEGVRIDATFLLIYKFNSVAGETIESLADNLTKYRAMPDAWPYFREFIQSVTNRMGLPPFSLPLFDPENVTNSPISRTSSAKRESKRVGREKPVIPKGRMNRRTSKKTNR